jgi:hypothetical protein
MRKRYSRRNRRFSEEWKNSAIGKNISDASAVVDAKESI